jgi:hypothetical protein
VIAGTCFISGGMDNSIKLWNIDAKDMDEAITQSYTYDAAAERRPFNTRMIHRPHYSTNNVCYFVCCGFYQDFCAGWVSPVVCICRCTMITSTLCALSETQS